jgi:peptide/nickel transport system permease protein
MSGTSVIEVAGVQPSAPRPGFGFRVGAGAGILAITLVLAIAAPLVAPHDPYDQDLMHRLLPPIWSSRGSWEHVLGTDQLGRDYLSRVIYGTRVSLALGCLATALAGLIGATLGVAAGYFGERIDDAVSFAITTRLAMPIVLIAMSAMSIIGGSTVTIIVVIGLLSWDRFAVVARSATQQIRGMGYVLAAQVSGASHFRILWHDLVPNIIGPLTVVAALEVANVILLEAAMSFLGFGVPPPTPSWGLMMAEGREQMFFNPWLICIPGAALFVLVLAVNVLADGLRDRRRMMEDR